ncbi:MAG TPA: hypothetical protein VGM52_10300, partial [Herbaspirillum sp.]
SVKVGHRQAVIPENPRFFKNLGFFYVRHTKPHTHTNKNRPGSRRVGLFISAAIIYRPSSEAQSSLPHQLIN